MFIKLRRLLKLDSPEVNYIAIVKQNRKMMYFVNGKKVKPPKDFTIEFWCDKNSGMMETFNG